MLTVQRAVASCAELWCAGSLYHVTDGISDEMGEFQGSQTRARLRLPSTEKVPTGLFSLKIRDTEFWTK